MAYKPGKPVATDDLSVSQTDLLGNFAAIRTVSDPDHGMALFPRQVAVPVTAATTVGLISQDSITSPGTTALKFAPQAGGATIDFTSSLNANPGWFRLPCGILMKWGNFALVGGANYTSHDAFPVAGNKNHSQQG